MSIIYIPYGKHVLLDLFDLQNSSLLNDHKRLDKIFKDAIKCSGATLIKDQHHQFEPEGLSGAYILSESHLTYHTYPEFGHLFLDIFTCGSHCDPSKAKDYIMEQFGITAADIDKYRTNEIERGVLPV